MRHLLLYRLSFGMKPFPVVFFILGLFVIVVTRAGPEVGQFPSLADARDVLLLRDEPVVVGVEQAEHLGNDFGDPECRNVLVRLVLQAVEVLDRLGGPEAGRGEGVDLEEGRGREGRDVVFL